MQYFVQITPQAKQELSDIAYFIALDNPVRAKKFVKALVQSFSGTLSIFPESGMIYKQNIRKISHKGYTAFYRIKEREQQVDILHIINLSKPLSARDIDLN